MRRRGQWLARRWEALSDNPVLLNFLHLGAFIVVGLFLGRLVVVGLLDLGRLLLRPFLLTLLRLNPLLILLLLLLLLLLRFGLGVFYRARLLIFGLFLFRLLLGRFFPCLLSMLLGMPTVVSGIGVGRVGP